MIKERTLEVIQFLNKERLASYKEIAKELGYQERVIRYEIERINDELSLSGFEEIQKLKKGMLMVPDKLDLNQILEEGEYIFSSKERKNRQDFSEQCSTQLSIFVDSAVCMRNLKWLSLIFVMT